jgi:hypothetical protein
VLDVVFNEDQSRLRKGHGAANMAVVRHFAVNQVRTAQEPKPRRAQPRDPAASDPAPTPEKQASNFVEKSPDGTSNTSKTSSQLKSVNPDSEPWRAVTTS